jgi:hypothetical protein
MHPVRRTKSIRSGQAIDSRTHRKRTSSDNQSVIRKKFFSAISVSDEEFVV